VSSEEANDQRALAKQLGGIHFDMILIEQAEFRSAFSDFQSSILKTRGFELGGAAMHRFDGLVRRVIRRSSGFERLLEFV
jgi:hypothetical protein